MKDKRIFNTIFLIITIIYTVFTLCESIITSDEMIVELGMAVYLIGFIILFINRLFNKELNKALRILFISLIITIVMNTCYVIMPEGDLTISSLTTAGILFVVEMILHKIVLAINIICTLKEKNNSVVRFLLMLVTILLVPLIIGAYPTEIEYWVLGIIYIYIAIYMFYLEKEVSLKEILKSIIIMVVSIILLFLTIILKSIIIMFVSIILVLLTLMKNF